LNSDYLSAEYSVIGSLLIEPSTALPTVSELLKPEDFTVEINRTIYKTILDMRESGDCIDPVTVIKRTGDTPEIRQYVMECMDVTSTAANAAAYAQIVANASMLRNIRDTAFAVGDMATNAQDYAETLGYAVDSFMALQERGTKADLVDSMEAMQDFYAYREKFDNNPESMFVKTGFENMDNVLGGGMVNQGLYILAARPGVGKTTLALNIADNVAKSKKSVLFISLEMSVRQITAKRIARNAGISYNALLMGELSADDYTKMAKASTVMSKLPVTINRRPGASVAQIESMARKVKGLKLLIVDYMGLIHPADRRKSRYEEMTETSGALKSLSIRLGIPILCLCQLNRESENDKGKRPKLHHLRDSGAIEQDADAVLLLHKPNAYASEEEKPAWESEELICYVDKNRHGNTGVAKFSFYGNESKLVPIRDRI